MKVTVITTVLNHAARLDATMRSVLALHRADLDYIVIDGGSMDGSIDIIKSHAGRLKCWLSEPDAGVYDAMNKGWALAAPDSRIIFIGAGDALLSLPDEDGPETEILYGNVQLNGGRMFHARTGLRLRLYNSLHHQALMIPKALHPDPPFDLAFPRYADFDFNQRLSRQGVCFRYAKGLSAYAAPGGVTGELHLDELTAVILKNYGPLWSKLSALGFSLARRLPLLRVFHPVRKGRDGRLLPRSKV